MNNQTKRQEQINKFINEFKEMDLPSSDFTRFKANMAKNRLPEFNLIYSEQTMIGNGTRFTKLQLDPDVYQQVKKAINYHPKSRYLCIGNVDLSNNKVNL